MLVMRARRSHDQRGNRQVESWTCRQRGEDQQRVPLVSRALMTGRSRVDCLRSDGPSSRCWFLVSSLPQSSCGKSRHVGVRRQEMLELQPELLKSHALASWRLAIMWRGRCISTCDNSSQQSLAPEFSLSPNLPLREATTKLTVVWNPFWKRTNARPSLPSSSTLPHPDFPA